MQCSHYGGFFGIHTTGGGSRGQGLLPPPRNSDALAGSRLPARALLLGGLLLLAAGPAAAQVTSPSVPRNFAVTAGDAQLTLTWEAPSSWGSWDAAGFEIQWKVFSVPSQKWSSVLVGGAIPSFTPTTTSAVFTLQQTDSDRTEYVVRNGQIYDLRIRAVSNQSGTSNYRDSDWVVVRGSKPVSPLALQVAEGNQQLDLSWTAASGTVTGYDVDYVDYTSSSASALDGTRSDGDASKGWVPLSRSGTTASQAITSLTNGTVYWVRVRWENTTPDPDEHGRYDFARVTPRAAGSPVWSGTLTVADIGSDLLGCNTACPTSWSFTRGGELFTITTVLDTTTDHLFVRFDKTVTDSLKELRLRVGTREFALSEATVESDDTVADNPRTDNQLWWSSAGLSWTVGNQVSLSLVEHSSNADLSGLEASSATGATASFGALTLAPAFDAATASYSATVANSITHVKLKPTVAQSDATVTVQGTTVASASDKPQSSAVMINLGIGLMPAGRPIAPRIHAGLGAGCGSSE